MIYVYDNNIQFSHGASVTLISVNYIKDNEQQLDETSLKIVPFVLVAEEQETKSGEPFYANSGLYFEKFLNYYNLKKNYMFFNSEILLKLRSPRKYWWLIANAFSYRVSSNQDIDSGFSKAGSVFLRVGDVFAVSSNLTKPDTFTESIDFEKYPYNTLKLKFKELFERSRDDPKNERIPDGILDSGFKLPFEKNYFSLNYILSESVFYHGNNNTDKISSFYIIPQTQECDLVNQLYNLYSDMLEEFKLYDHRVEVSLDEYIKKKKEQELLYFGNVEIIKDNERNAWEEYKEYTARGIEMRRGDFLEERLLVEEFLQSMKNFFYVKNKGKRDK